MPSKEDGDRYFWGPDSAEPVEQWLRKTRPSILTDDETPWIWVQGVERGHTDPEQDKGHGEALAKAYDLLDILNARLQEIEEDDSIPARGKKGVKSKKQTRDEAHAETTEHLKQLSIESKWTVGKWLFFPRHSEVDGIWYTLAQSVAKGPLKDAGVFLSKVAPSSSRTGDNENPTHVICLYMQDIYDQKTVRKVLVTLLLEHGLEPSACKSDLYTLAGIDSNHPTKLRSSIWRTHEIIEGGGEAIKKMKEEYASNKRNRARQDPDAPKGPSVGADGIIDSDTEDEKISAINKRKLAAAPAEARSAKVVKGDEDGAREKEVNIVKPPAKKVQNGKSAAVKYMEEDIFADPGDDSD